MQANAEQKKQQMQKKPSMAAAKRVMDAERARLAGLESQGAPKSAALEQRLATYVPRCMDEGEWRQIKPLLTNLMRRGKTQGETVFRQLVSDLALYLVWAHRRGTPLTVAGTMRHDLIEQWVADMDHGNSTRNSRRGRLLNLASQVNPGATAPRKRAPIARPAMKPPYTRREVADLERLANNQPTPARKRQLAALLALGLGAGLGPEDLRDLRRSDITQNAHDVWWVHVAGRRPRRVPVRDRYVVLLQQGLKGVKESDLIIGRSTTRHNITGTVTDSIATDSFTTAPDQGRLRATWLLALVCAPIPISAIFAAAGINTARTITDILQYANDPDYVSIDGSER